jgi:hypothetical protein
VCEGERKKKQSTARRPLHVMDVSSGLGSGVPCLHILPTLYFLHEEGRMEGSRKVRI